MKTKILKDNAISLMKGVRFIARWKTLAGVLIWNILDSLLAVLIKSPFWGFLILVLLDSLINIFLIVKILHGKNIFKLWKWDLAIFAWSCFMSFFFPTWMNWIVDPIVMIIVCFLVALIPMDSARGERIVPEQATSDPLPTRKVVKRNSEFVASLPDNDTKVSIVVSSNPMKKDKE